MARILVADDNSNVQKTAQLALADLGADIISVNNGEAAVRNLATLTPDLVLADIFMPVRNGYEVCEYIKKTPALAHVPVVLLVGAFDPLDEREAQRVGADGILKKPFVPTNPLITMVKTLLDRTASQHPVQAPVSVVPAAVAASVAGSVAANHSPAAEMPEEPADEEFPVPTEPVAFSDLQRPVAFSQLLDAPETPTMSPATSADPTDTASLAEEQMVRQRDPNLGQPTFWHSESSTKETESEKSTDEAASVPENIPESVSESEPAIGLRDPQESSATHEETHEEPMLLQPVEPFELVRDEPDHTAESVVVSEKLVTDPAATARLSVESAKAEDLAINPLEWLETAPKPEPVAAPESETPIEAANEASAIPPAEPSPEPSPEPSKDLPLAAATNTDAGKDSPRPAAHARPQSAEDTLPSIPQQDWAALTAAVQENTKASATLETGIFPLDLAKRVSSARESAARPTAAADPDLVEAVAQRVLDRMRPQVVELVTTELLKPIVVAMIQREIEIMNRTSEKISST